MSAPFVDPREQNPLARMISDALNPMASYIKRDVQEFGRRTAEGGLPLALAQGFNDIPMGLTSLLANLPGAQGASRGLVQALAGRKGVEALGLGAPAPDVSQEPMQGPMLPPSEPQPVGPSPQQQAVQAFTPFTPLEHRTLPDPRPIPPPDFTAAREALGPPIEAQQIGQGEQFSRGLGGMAAGGLQAIQGAPAGRAATTGEVIAGVGAGGAQALAALHQESRQLEAFAQASNQMRNRQLSAIESAQSALIAEQDMRTAQAWNAKEAAQVQMDLSVDIANMNAGAPIQVTDGLADPRTGQILITKQQSMLETYQALILQHQVYQLDTSVTAQVLGQKVFKDNISSPMKPAYLTAVQAAAMPEFVDMAIKVLDKSGKGILAEQVDRLRNAGSKAATSNEHAQQIASLFLTEIASMFMEQVRAAQAGIELPYGNAFNEPYRLMLQLGGATPYPGQMPTLPGINPQ